MADEVAADTEVALNAEVVGNKEIAADTEGKQKRTGKQLAKKIFSDWWASVVVALVFLFIHFFVGEAAYIPSESMVPTLQVHDVLAIDKITKPNHLKDGEIVVFHPPVEGQEKESFIKRLIGVGGDTIEIRDGKLYRNGKAVDEPYIAEPMNYVYGPITVPEGKFFFLGDNRNNSFDSHLWPNGPFVSPDAIVGRAVFRMYPFNEMGTMK
ncbi:MAG: signal peptidase I [Tumebacillaceae bacterium]